MPWPAGLSPARCEMGLVKQSTQHRSELSGVLQGVVTGVEFWEMTLSFDPRNFHASGRLEALLNQLTGGEQEVTAWHFAREAPRGTMRGTPQLQLPAAQFAREFSLAGAWAAGGAPGTLLTGDMIKVGDTLLQVAEDATASSGGVMLVKTVNRLRRSAMAGSAVAWNRCSARFIMPDNRFKASHSRGVMQGTSVTLVESP